MKVFEAREMNTERWRKIDQIYNEALGLSPDLRAGFVAKSCAGDEKLQREIEALLAVDTSAPDVLLDQPVMQIAAETEVTSGSRLGPYEIPAKCWAQTRNGQGISRTRLAALDARRDQDAQQAVLRPGSA